MIRSNRDNRSGNDFDERIAYCREAVPDSQNAFPLWRAAAEAAVAIERGAEACDAGTGSCSVIAEAGMPSPDEIKRRHAAIEHNRKALELIDAGIERGGLQLPEIASPENFGVAFDLLSPWRDLARVRSWRVEQALADGNVRQAIHDVVALVRFGDLFSNAEGTVVHYLCGVAFRCFATDSLILMADQRLSWQAFEELFEAVNSSLQLPDGLERAMLVDFYATVLPLIERIPESAGIQQLIEVALTSDYGPQAPDLSGECLPDAETRLAWRHDRLLQVLQGHPQPFDKEGTIALMKWRLADAIDELRSPWAPRLMDFGTRLQRWRRQWHTHRLLQATRCWPFQLTPVCHVKGLGESDDARQWLAKMAHPLDRWFSVFRPLTDRDIPRVRRRLRSVSNPIGLLLAEHHAPFLTARQSMLQHRLYLAAAKTMLAIQMFQTERGRLPVALAELVDAGIVTAIPQDPYSRGALRYSSRDRFLWSVGQDGRNRRGRCQHSPKWAPGFCVRWKVPVP